MIAKTAIWPQLVQLVEWFEVRRDDLSEKKLEGFSVLVAGGTGAVGRGIVSALIEQGARVIVPSRSADSLARLTSELSQLAQYREDLLHTIIGDLGSLESARLLCEGIVSKWGTPRAIVSSIGGNTPPMVKIQEMRAETFEAALDANLIPHFVALRTFFPLLIGTEGASYTIVAGAAGETAWSGYGAMNIPSAAVMMMARVLSQDAATTAIRTNVIVINGHIATTTADSSEKTVQPKDVGSLAAWIVSAEAKMLTGNVLHLNPRNA